MEQFLAKPLNMTVYITYLVDMWLVKICVVWACLTYITKDWLLSLFVAIPLATLDSLLDSLAEVARN